MVVQVRVAGSTCCGASLGGRRALLGSTRDRCCSLRPQPDSASAERFSLRPTFRPQRSAPGQPRFGGCVSPQGVTAIVLGSLGRQWAISTLGRFFTLNVQISEDQRVVTNGPYRWVRHPSYTADLLAFTGIGLALGNWLALLAAATLPLLGLLVRIHVEERALLPISASRTAPTPRTGND